MSFHIPPKPRNNSRMTGARSFWRRLISAHPALTHAGQVRRAELLSMLSLVSIAFFIVATLFQPQSSGILLASIVIAFLSFLLGKTAFPWAGAYVFAYGLTAVGFAVVFQGAAESVEAFVSYAAIASFIISSVLLTRRGLLGLILISATALWVIPFFSTTLFTDSNAALRSGGILLILGGLLYGAMIYRKLLEKEKNRELNDAIRELEGAKEILGERLRSRSAELQEAVQQTGERASRLQVLSEISQEIATHIEQNPTEYLTHIARIISDKLGYYHVGIFVIDDNHEHAVLRASNSKGGQRMLARRHQLQVGGAGIVGYVAQSGRLRIALDTGADAVFFNNPDLPETRSEIAIPLKYGTSILGVLDVQSHQPSAFKPEDGTTLSALASQIAIALSGLQRGGAAELASLLNRRGRRGSAPFGQRQAHPAYSFLPDGTTTNAAPENNPNLTQMLASGEPVILNPSSKNISPVLAVPVKLRDQIIGVIQVEAADADRKWTEDEMALVQAISERAALALENARLFENATRRAEQEETIARVTTRIGSSTDFNHILQTTIQELGQALGVSRSFIQLKTPPADDPA